MVTRHQRVVTVSTKAHAPVAFLPWQWLCSTKSSATWPATSVAVRHLNQRMISKKERNVPPTNRKKKNATKKENKEKNKSKCTFNTTHPIRSAQPNTTNYQPLQPSYNRKPQQFCYSDEIGESVAQKPWVAVNLFRQSRYSLDTQGQDAAATTHPRTRNQSASHRTSTRSTIQSTAVQYRAQQQQ